MRFIRMRFVLASFLFSITAVASQSYAADISFHCSNAPASVWGEYYMVSGTTTDFSEIKVYQFGLVEGSTRAQEEEPVNTVEEIVAKPNYNERATSAQWRDAIPFDLTTEVLGKAILYVHPSEFSVAGSKPTVRLKIGGKDLRLTCGH